MKQSRATGYEDEIDIKEIFSILYRYWGMIAILVLLSGVVTGYYAYFMPNLYKASATVEVGVEHGGYGGQDMLSKAMDPGAVSADSEMDIIKSRFLVEKALKKINFTHRYYVTRRFKEVELYDQSPIQVGLLRGVGISFDFYPIDATHYRLVVPSKGRDWSYDEVLLYGEEIVTTHFHLNIIKHRIPTESRYRFVVYSPEAVVREIQGGVSVRQKSKHSTLLEISYYDHVPKRAQAFANALSEAYIEQSIEKKTKEATRKLAFIDNQLKFITQSLRGSAIKLEEFKRASNTVDLSRKAKTLSTQLQGYELQLSEVTMREVVLDRLFKQIDGAENLESLSIAGLDMSESSLALKLQELQDSVVKKRILREEYTEISSEVIKLSRKILQLKEIIIATIRNLRANIKERRMLLESAIAKAQKAFEQLPADERVYGELERRFVVNEKIYSYLLGKRSETAIIKASTVSKNRIIDRALVPEGPIKPKRKLIVLAGVVFGGILGVVLAFIRAFLDDRIKEEEDISKMTDLPILALIPHLEEGEEKPKETIKVFDSPKSLWAESFRNLRTNLQFMNTQEGSQSIAITSTVGKEGKTTICVNLGGIMSMAEKRTVILGLDMRKPTLHKKFGLHNHEGMSTLLSGTTRLNDVIQHTNYPRLDIIASGPIPPNPSELIQSELMAKVLEKLKEVYDVIILDTPPIGLVTDARVLMHLADLNLYLLKADYSKKSFLHTINQLSEYPDIHSMGIVLNNLKMTKHGYGNGYGYYEEKA